MKSAPRPQVGRGTGAFWMPSAVVTICTASGARQVSVRSHANRGLGGWIPGQFLIGSSVEHRVSGLSCGVARDPRDARALMQTAPCRRRCPASQMVALDGKTARRAHDRGHGRSALHPVSAYACESRLVLAQTAVEAKSNELPVRPLLRDLAGTTVTVDALGCWKNPARHIRSQQADYVWIRRASGPTCAASCWWRRNDGWGVRSASKPATAFPAIPPMPDTCWRPRGHTG